MLRDLLAQTAALAVKQARSECYLGAWNVADTILREGTEVMEHRGRILGIKALVQEIVQRVESNHF